MRKNSICIFLIMAVSTFAGCPGKEIPQEINLSFGFEESMEDWTGDFADYPVQDSTFYELTVTLSNLPPEVDEQRKGIKISGNNHSDDLFMFIKKRITGLQPNTDYMVIYYLSMASNSPAGSIGIGGSPGESVYLKAGASIVEPKKTDDGNGYFVMNIDKGNQAEGGVNMYVIGNIAASESATGYELINRDSEPKIYDSHLPYSIRTGDEGALWLIIGTDSGFEGTTTLYYDEIRIILQPR